MADVEVTPLAEQSIASGEPSPRRKRVQLSVDVPKDDGDDGDVKTGITKESKQQRRTRSLRKAQFRRLSVEAVFQVQQDVKSLFGSQPTENTGEEEKVGLGKCKIHPESRFKLSWDAGQGIALLYLAVTIPLRLCFGTEARLDEPVFWLELVLYSSFVADIAINFVTAYVNNDGELVADSKKIALRYGKRWFLIDFVSCIPFTYIGLIADSSGRLGNLQGLKTLRLIRLTKLLRLKRLSPLLKMLDERVDSVSFATTGATLLAMGMGLLYLAHVVCCIWFYIGSFDDCLQDGTLVQGWVNEMHCVKISGDKLAPRSDCRTCVKANDSTGYVAADSPFDPVVEVGMWHLWLTAFYWAVTTLTTVGYGDITANTEAEMGFSIMAECVGTVIFSIVMGTLSKLVSKGEVLRGKHDMEQTAIKEFMTAKRIPKNLQLKVRKYMDHLFAFKRGFDS